MRGLPLSKVTASKPKPLSGKRREEVLPASIINSLVISHAI
ncbi:MAG: hypothetical protein FD156_930 [Nitrospirae bacterium]|nr:MAG: hypothetical protein FD156_930 [Nitrospirota bacterium]